MSSPAPPGLQSPGVAQNPQSLRRSLEQLQRAGAFPHAVDEFRLLETHISFVLLTGPFAYKFKKPLRLPFLDFSTLALRGRSCEEEMRLNRRAAPELYERVVRMTDSPAGPELDGRGLLLEYAVKMRQFPQSARADTAIARGNVGCTHIEAFAGLLAHLHAGAEAKIEDSYLGSAPCVTEDAFSNLRELRQAGEAIALGRRSARTLDRLDRWTAHATIEAGVSAARRKSAGHVRECHGDLHLANLVLLDDALIPFDCIEFNERLRWIDTMSDLAFLLMDLEAHGRPDLGRVMLNGYLQRTGDFDGLTVLRFYEVYRALVRAKVAALEAAAGAAGAVERMNRQIALAGRFALAQHQPRLVLLHGPSGSGKSWLVRELMPHADFVCVRSDVERRRLFGTLDPMTAVEPTPYTGDATARTYDRLGDCARTILESGRAAVVDATFLDAALREGFRTLASALGVPYRILDVTAPRAVMAARIERRAQEGGDPSEADLRVLDHQLQAPSPLTPEETPVAIRVDTAAPLDARAIAARLFPESETRDAAANSPAT